MVLVYYKDMSLITKILLALKTIRNYPVFLLDYFRVLHRDITYSIRPGALTMRARGGTNDCKEIIVVMSGHEYPLHLLPPLESPVIFDVGAHIGSFSVFACQYYRNQNPRVFAFEPNRKNFRYLEDNVERNAVSKNCVKLFPYALSDHDGMGKLDISTSHDAYTLAENPKGAYEECPVRTLPSLVKEIGIEHIDILKMDIEGGEYRVFSHEPTFEFIKNSVSFLFIEHHFVDSEHNANWIRKKLHDDFELISEHGDVFIFQRFQNRHTIDRASFAGIIFI